MAEQNVTMEAILEAVQSQRTAITSMSTLLGGIKARLNQELQGEISPQGQAKLNEIMSEIQGNTRSILNATLNNDDDPTNDVNDDGSPKGPAETDKIATSTSLSTSKTIVNVGDNFTLTAGVSSGGSTEKAITGTVTFASEAGEIGRAGVDSTGVAALSISDMAPGDHELTATYGGDAAYASSTSGSVLQSVLPRQNTQQQSTGQAPQATTGEAQGGVDAGVAQQAGS